MEAFVVEYTGEQMTLIEELKKIVELKELSLTDWVSPQFMADIVTGN